MTLPKTRGPPHDSSPPAWACPAPICAPSAGILAQLVPSRCVILCFKIKQVFQKHADHM